MTKIIYNSVVLEEKLDNVSRSFDYFFLAIGSDFRAYEALRIAEANKLKVENVILFEFDERVEDVKAREAEGAQLYSKISYSKTNIKCSIKNPSEALKEIQKSGQLPIKEDCSIAVDISCFTKPFFFTLLKWLHVIHKIKYVTIFYSEPKMYVFDKGLYSAYHSSCGPIRVEEIPSFSGDDLKNEQSLLVIMLGFDGDLSSEINEDVAPKKTVVVNGFPSYSPNFKDISLISNEKLVNTNGNSLVYSRANSPFETYNLLDKLKGENPRLFMNIAPLGSKPMALGVCLFAIHNPDVRVIYPMPEKFENVTTSASWCTWSYQISLDKETDELPIASAS